MHVVGLVSCYLEGSLSRGAIESLQRVGLDRLLVYEGPAGPPIEAPCPPSWLPSPDAAAGVIVRHGRWRTDARKRQSMLEDVQKMGLAPPVWGVLIDGDEVLVNAEYLRDVIQRLAWDDETKGASPTDPDNPPWSKYPVRLIEAGGNMSLMTGRVIRLDLIRRYRVSTSVVVNMHGVEEGYGNVQQSSQVWIEHFLGAMDNGLMVAWPPLPCEPHIFHRSAMRHPNRADVRMSAQETEELQRKGIK